MSPDDAELMLWALAHGWSVKVFSRHAGGSLWRDPTRRRFLVHGAGPAPGVPLLSPEVRARMADARAAATTTLLQQEAHAGEENMEKSFRFSGFSQTIGASPNP